MGYKEDDTLFDVLFATKEAEKFSKDDSIIVDFYNSEVNGDSRNVVGSDGEILMDMDFLSKKLYGKSIENFGLGHGHDLADFDTYHKVRGLRWPVVDGKETQWRFITKYDPYAKK